MTYMFTFNLRILSSDETIRELEIGLQSTRWSIIGLSKLKLKMLRRLYKAKQQSRSILERKSNEQS